MFSLSRAIQRPQLVNVTKNSLVRNSFRSYAAIGDRIPSISVYEGSPGNDVNLAEEASSGKAVVIGIPGCFSPACSSTHVPGYIKNIRAFNDKGYFQFYVVSVNDAFVTKAWGEKLLGHNVAGAQIRFLADPKGEFTKELDLLFDASKFFGNERSKRYALLVEDGKIVKTFIEPDNTSVTISAADKVLEEA